MASAPHILVVDDDPASQLLLRIALQQVGYTVQVAGTGQAALAQFDADPSDLVILDAWLPDMDGFTVCIELRRRSRVPIVILTALNSTEDIVHGFSAEADDYILKPYHLRVVLARLRAVLCRGHRPKAQLS